MHIALAEGIVALLGVYLGLGLLFTIAFLAKGLVRIDPAAAESSWGFRLIIAPGVVALWPILARRWFGGKSRPPLENNPHRQAACALHGQKVKPS